jgi:dipeptidyl aminopeptidase/acylaminoacyl peptidase
VIVAAAAFVASSNILRVSTTATPVPTVSAVPPTPSPTATPTAEPVVHATSTASPILIAGNLIAVYHLTGETAEILTIDPSTGQRQQVGTMPVALQPLGENVFAATFGPGWASLQISTDRRLITVSMDGDGSFPRAQFDVTNGQIQSISLRDEAYVSPDGRSFAIVADDPSVLRVVDLAGNQQNEVALLAEAGYFSRINWALDGSAVVLAGFDPIGPTGQLDPGSDRGQVYAATVGGPGWEYFVPLTGGQEERFGGSADVELGVGQVSPDLREIVAPVFCQAGAPARVCVPGLVKINVQSGEISQLTTTETLGELAWSPDGSRIAFTNGTRQQRGVWTVNADGSGLARLTAPDRPALDHDIAWAPDGSAIVFTRGTTNDFGKLGEVYVIPATGGEPSLLISDSIADW